MAGTLRGAFLARGGEDLPHHPFALADPHIQNLRTLDVHEVLARLLRPVCSFSCCVRLYARRFADQRLAAARRTVEEEAFRSGVLETLKEFLGCSSGSSIASRIARERFLLATDFFPRQLRHFIEVILIAMRARASSLDRDPVIRVRAHLVAHLQLLLHEQIAALQHQRLLPVLRADAESIRAQHLVDLTTGPSLSKPRSPTIT